MRSHRFSSNLFSDRKLHQFRDDERYPFTLAPQRPCRSCPCTEAAPMSPFARSAMIAKLPLRPGAPLKPTKRYHEPSIMSTGKRRPSFSMSVQLLTRKTLRSGCGCHVAGKERRVENYRCIRGILRNTKPGPPSCDRRIGTETSTSAPESP